MGDPWPLCWWSPVLGVFILTKQGINPPVCYVGGSPEISAPWNIGKFHGIHRLDSETVVFVCPPFSFVAKTFITPHQPSAADRIWEPARSRAVEIIFLFWVACFPRFCPVSFFFTSQRAVSSSRYLIWLLQSCPNCRWIFALLRSFAGETLIRSLLIIHAESDSLNHTKIKNYSGFGCLFFHPGADIRPFRQRHQGLAAFEAAQWASADRAVYGAGWNWGHQHAMKQLIRK